MQEKNIKPLPIGKLQPKLLESRVLSATGALRREVLVGPGIGEDAAVIDISGKEGYLVVASDPVVGASYGSGKLLVHVNVNDVACKGGDPAYLMVTLLSPKDLGIDFVETIMSEIDVTCKEMNISVIGGHTEITDRYDHPVIVGTILGRTQYNYNAKDIREGDLVIMTAHTGIEGMSIIANDRPDLLEGFLSPDEIKEISGWTRHLSVYPESKLVRDIVKFMHDPTEGGVVGGMAEIARSSGLSVDIADGEIPVHELTRRASEKLGFDFGHLISSGVLVAVVDPAKSDEVLSRFSSQNMDAAIIGKMTADKGDPGLNTHEELWRILDM